MAVVARSAPCLLAGDFNVKPTKIPCLSKGISAGLWVGLDAAWFATQGRHPAVTCKRSWVSTGGSRRDFLVGCPLATAALLSCSVASCRWLQPHFAVSAMFDCDRWSCRVAPPIRSTPLWPASWLPALDKSRGSKSVEVQRVWEVYDDRLRFMSRADSDGLTSSLLDDYVSSAWAVWSSAAETVLADAYCFSGGPVPDRGLVLGRGTARLRVVRRGGHKVRKVRGSAVDPADGGDIHLFRDSSIALLLDLRRRLKVVFDLLGGMIRNGFSLARSFELTDQWSCILSAGPLHPVTMDDLLSVQSGLGWFREVVGDLHARPSDFIHRIVVPRRDEAIRSWRGWLREDPLVRPYRWLRPDLVPPFSFLRCDPRLTPGWSGVLASPDRIDEEFRKAWLPYFCRSGQREASLEEFSEELVGWLPLLPEVDMTPVTGDDLFQVVRCETATAGSLDGWGWREVESLPVPWFDGLARIFAKVEEFGVWPEGLLDANIAMIPKVGGDSTPLGQRPLSVLPVVCRIWASDRMKQLEDWFKSWVPSSVYCAGNGRSSVEAWYTSALDIEEVLVGAVDTHVHIFVADVVKSFDTVDRGILDRVLNSLGLPAFVPSCVF